MALFEYRKNPEHVQNGALIPPKLVSPLGIPISIFPGDQAKPTSLFLSYSASNLSATFLSLHITLLLDFQVLKRSEFTQMISMAI